MKKRNAFTLIELLGVILVIGILLIIAVPQVMKIMKKGTKSYYHSVENSMRTSGMDYMETYRTLLPREKGNVAVVQLSELMDNNYIDKVTDEKGNLCEGQVAVEKVKKDSYSYHSCLKCGDYYESATQDCEYSEINNHYSDSGNYAIVISHADANIDPNCDYDKYQRCYVVNQLEKFTSPYASVFYKDSQDNVSEIKNDLKGNPTTVDTKTLGYKEVTYYYHGAIAKMQVQVKEDDAPTKPDVVLKTENNSGKTYKGTWYSGNIYVKFKSTDYAEQGVAGSGIDHYEVSDNVNGPYTAVTGNYQRYTAEGRYVRYVRAVDKSGNISPVTSYEIKIDKTKPKCTWTGESTDWQPKVSSYPNESDRNNFKRTIKVTCDDAKSGINATSGCSTKSKSKTYTYSASEQTHNQTHTVIDNAGNYTDCTRTLNIYIDKVKPTISAKANPLTRNNDTTYAFTSNLNYSDSLSDIKSVSCNPAYSAGTGVYNVTCTATDNVGLQNSVTFQVKHQYQVGKSHVTSADLCGGHHKCNENNSYWNNCQDGWEPPDVWSCDCEGEAWRKSSNENGNVCKEHYDWCENDCDVYTCTDEARHADGSKTSRSDSWCYYK